MNEILITFFANVFAKFKQKNPAVAGVLALIALTVVAFAEHGTLLGVFTLPVWASNAVKIVGALFLTVNGAHTSEYLRKKEW